MTIDQALEQGYLALSDEEADQVLHQLDNLDDPHERFDKGLGLLLTFVPEEHAGAVLDLAALVAETYDEIEESDGKDMECDCGHDHLN